MKKKYLLISVGVAILTAGVLFAYTFRKNPETFRKTTAAFEVTASEITGEYEMDEASANAKYLDQVVEVEGRVIETDFQEDKLFVYLEGGLTGGVACAFPVSDEEVKAVSKGETIKVKGKCTGYILDVVLSRCCLVK